MIYMLLLQFVRENADGKEFVIWLEHERMTMSYLNEMLNTHNTGNDWAERCVDEIANEWVYRHEDGTNQYFADFQIVSEEDFISFGDHKRALTTYRHSKRWSNPQRIKRVSGAVEWFSTK